MTPGRVLEGPDRERCVHEFLRWVADGRPPECEPRDFSTAPIARFVANRRVVKRGTRRK